MSSIIVSDLYVYPVKSLPGIRVNELMFTNRGLLHDRRYMLVNASHRFISQRSHSILSQFNLYAVAGGWLVKAPGGEEITIYDDSVGQRTLDVTVWRETLPALEKSNDVSRWFSKQLDELVYLVEMEFPNCREARHDQHVAAYQFADAYPLLVCNQRSLEWLNNQLQQELSMSRFRPNVVITMPVNMEYHLTGLKNAKGEYLLFTAPCVRCNVPAINPQSGAFEAALHAQLRDVLKREDDVVFGMNAITQRMNALHLGDELMAF